MTLNKVSACGKRGCGACGVPPLAGGRRLQGCKVSVSVCYTGFASFKLSHFRQIVTTRRPALAQVSESAQALEFDPEALLAIASVTSWFLSGLVLSPLAAEDGNNIGPYCFLFFAIVSYTLLEPLRADIKLPS